MKDHNRIITCASFGGTGSSVITDLLKEFNNVKSMGDYEFSILYDVDGISDLEHYIVEDFHRLKTDEGIYRFKKLVKILEKGYSEYFGSNFKEISQEYIRDLVDISWLGNWHMHQYRYSNLRRILMYKIPEKFQKILLRIKKNKHSYELVPKYHKVEMNLSCKKDEFYKITKNYTEKLLCTLDPNKEYDYLALDQLIPPTNIERYLNYLNDIKVIVVDRDPRDLYLLNNLFWNEGWIPSNDVNQYIKWFRLLRDNINNNEDENRILRIRFEDFIYDYENTLKKIMTFIGLDRNNHISKYKFFNPNVSEKNCFLWKKYKVFDQEIDLISKELKEFCYEYSGFDN